MKEGLTTRRAHAGEPHDPHGSPHSSLCTTTHPDMTPDERARRGISVAMLRLSVGLEDADDPITDLEQALA